MSSWMIRNRSLRSRVPVLPDDWYRLDTEKTKAENAYDIYNNLSSKSTSEARRLSLLNAFVKVLDPVSGTFPGFTTEELLYCLSASLIHLFTQVRAGSLRAIRHLLKTSKDLQIFNGLQINYLVCRSLDVLLENEEERVQALKLVRKMLAISPDIISPVIVRSLVSLCESGVEDGDRMLRACLATLCELGVLNPMLLIVCGGVGAITRNVLECHSPRIAESLCGVLLHLLEWPQTRNIAGVRLDCLAAPYCDFTYRLGIMDKNKDARDLRFTCSRLALLSVSRSWAGTIEFCDPNKPSGLKAIVDVLYLNQREVRKAILDLLYELLWLPQPVWTDEYSVALAVIDPADYQDAWRLPEGFVAMEGRNVLPSLANRVPNICEIHTALQLYCFLETGLLNALVEVVVSSDTFISVRATVLIGKLLQLMHTHLPVDIFSTSSALPTLVSHATQGNHQARAAITALQNLHQMQKNRPAACSLFLDIIIQSGDIINSKIFKRELDTSDVTAVLPQNSAFERRRHDSVSSSTSIKSSTDESTSSTTLTFKRSSLNKSYFKQFISNLKQNEKLMRDSNVLLIEDGKSWDWDIIIAILKSDALTKMDDNQLRFIRRLINFYKPSSNRFSHEDLGHGRHIPAFVLAGVELIDWLLQCQELECIRLLTDLFSDINTQLEAITTSKSAHDCLFSPQHMSSTMCQQYFLFIGRMCRTQPGLTVLNNTNIFKQLLNLVTTTMHVCYIKLIVSGLDYTQEAYPRVILEKAMTSSDRRSGRLYATQFMLVLLRAKTKNFEVWGLPLLIKQTKDSERTVVLAALEILDEAAHERMYLEELVSIWPDFEVLGDRGKLLMTRNYSIPRGLNHTNARIQKEIELWVNGFNKRYVLLVEADTHAILTLHTKNDDGTYSRRSCSTRPTVIPPNILPHLYGQLVQTTKGLDNLVKYGDLRQLKECLQLAKCNNESDSLTLKAAMWALGHTSISKDGLEYLNDPVTRIFEKIIYLAKHCEVYSVRATALYVLGLVASTKDGANILYKYDWMSVRHDRDTYWPVCEPEDWLSKHLTPIRHHIDDVPPYNYTGIEDNINGLFYNANEESSAATYYFDESCDKVDASSDTEGQIQNSTRSNTLPESATKQYPYMKHTRSLSESKTTDGLSLMSANNQYNSSRPRFNSGTDSNTSGVSSCDSVYGRRDLHQTLSPIPSSSNLLEIKKSNERFRRISLTGAPFREHTLSPQDVQGYAKLRSIRRHQRPMLSESAADELAEIIDDGITNKLSLSHTQRKLKVRSLDRQSTLSYDEFTRKNLGRPFAPYEPKGPHYAGICLPKNILDLFHKPSNKETYVSRCVQEMDLMDITLNKQAFANENLLNEGDESSVSSLSDISTNSKRSKWIGKHSGNICLHCCRAKVYKLHSDISIYRRKNSNHSPFIQLSDTSFISSESVFSDGSMPDRITANILRHVQRMANPVTSKQSKMALLEMKQKHSSAFQDICLYSEVCKALSRNTYRLSARRFLQELFLDLDFESFYNEAIDIMNRKEREKDINQDFDVVDGKDNILTMSNIEHTFGNMFKTHIKSPQLASVYETSVENLSESIGKTKYIGNNNLNLNNKRTEEILNSDSSSVSRVGNSKDLSLAKQNQTSSGRPRFNTLELDLSCTKNKFPITDRRKNLNSPTTLYSVTDRFAPIRRSLSITTPAAGSLFCEKRCQTSKSETTLTNSN